MTIQNFETLFLEVDANTDTVFLPKERFLKDRKVSYLFAFNHHMELGDYTYNGIPLIYDDLVNCYLDVYGNDKGCLIAKQNLSQFSHHIKHKIDKILDLDLTKINIKTSVESNCYLPICVVYSTQFEQPEILATNNVTLQAQSTGGKVKLSSIGGYQLNGKQIKQIQVAESHNAYLTIRTKDNRNNIYDMPISLLIQNDQINDSNIRFDNLNIDTDNSFIRFEENDNISLTFKY